MPACFQSSSCRFASQILRSIPSGIHFCKPGTPGTATRPPFPNVRSSYLFRESAWLPFHTLLEAHWQESDVSAALYSPVPSAPESGFPAGAIPRCVQACSCRRLHNPPHLEVRRCCPSTPIRRTGWSCDPFFFFLASASTWSSEFFTAAFVVVQWYHPFAELFSFRVRSTR